MDDRDPGRESPPAGPAALPGRSVAAGRPGWIAGFAGAVDGCWAVVAAEATRLAAVGAGGRIEVVDQETEAVVAEHSVR